MAGLLAMGALWSLATLAQAPSPDAVATTGAVPAPQPPGPAEIAPLDGEEWNRFAIAIDTLRMCVEDTRAGRPPAQTVATLQALGLAGQIRGQALLLLPADDPARPAVEAAADDAQAIMRSFQAISAWQPVRPLDQALALAYVYHFEAQATRGDCLPTQDFVSNYEKALTR